MSKPGKAEMSTQGGATGGVLAGSLQPRDPDNVIRETPIERPEPCMWRTAACFTLSSVLSQGDCKAIIEASERRGFEAALLNVGGGEQVYNPGTRHSERCIIDDKVFAAELFDRIKPFVPCHYRDIGGEALPVAGLNERFRVLRYKPGH